MYLKLWTHRLAAWATCAVWACGVIAGCGSTPAAEDAGTTGSTDTTDTTVTDVAADDASADTTSDTAADTTADVVPSDPHVLTLMTYNVMCSFCINSDHPAWPQDWATRVPMLRDTIARYDPDLIGLQELFNLSPEDDQIGDLTKPEDIYGAVYYIKKPTDQIDPLGNSFDSFPDATILYRKSRFEVLKSGALWLSPTPEIAFSNGFATGGQFPRLVVWAQLRDKILDRTLTFASTHFDNNTPSQKMSAPLVLSYFEPMAAKEPVLFVGDFNSQPADEAYVIMDKGVDGKGFRFHNAYDLAPSITVASNRDPKPTPNPADRIDHFWLAGAVFTVEAWIWDFHEYGAEKMWPSDHDPMVARVRW